jgi:hypothetical protein
MSRSSSSEEVTYELARKALLWGPAVVGLLGPAGLLAGAAAAVAVMCSHSNDGSESNASQANENTLGVECIPSQREYTRSLRI